MQFFSIIRISGQVLGQIPSILGKKISKEYIENFEKADKTFQFQIIFDLKKRKQSPLNPTNEIYQYAGMYIFSMIKFNFTF